MFNLTNDSSKLYFLIGHQKNIHVFFNTLNNVK